MNTTTLYRSVFAPEVSRFNIVQHRYAEHAFVSGDGICYSVGFVEVLEIKNAPTPKETFVICRHSIADEEPSRYEISCWENLAAALGALDHNYEFLRKGTPEVLWGFVSTSRVESPWYYGSWG